MAFYGAEGGGPVGSMGVMAGPGALANMIRRRRKPGGLGGAGFKRRMGALPMPGLARRVMPPGMPSDVPGMASDVPGMAGEVDPGFNMPPGSPLQATEGDMQRRMYEGGPGRQPLAQDRVRWGGKIWQDPNKLWGWIQARGGGIAGSKEEFYRMHPDAARRLGMPVEGGGAGEEVFDPNNLRRGLIGQLTQAEDALGGAPARGVAHIANNRMRAVGAAQGRAAALAQVMSRRLRGGNRMANPIRRGYPVV